MATSCDQTIEVVDFGRRTFFLFFFCPTQLGVQSPLFVYDPICLSNIIMATKPKKRKVEDTMPKVVTFKSSTGSFLSNFYGIKFEYDGDTWPSSEHAYQFMRHQPNDRKDWTWSTKFRGKYAYFEYLEHLMEPVKVGKKLTSYYSQKVVEVEKRNSKIQYWKKKNMIGIVAKTMVKMFRAKGTAVPRKSKEEEWETYWKDILHAKFSNPEMKAKLKATGSVTLIEAQWTFKNKAKKVWYSCPWGGGYDKEQDRFYGLNWMGDFIMRTRHALFPEIPYVSWDSLNPSPPNKK